MTNLYEVTNMILKYLGAVTIPLSEERSFPETSHATRPALSLRNFNHWVADLTVQHTFTLHVLISAYINLHMNKRVYR